MSKRSGGKRTAIQRLSENMNSILASESKRRKLNQSAKQLPCKKLKLKPDPTSLFKQFKTNITSGDQINLDLTVGNSNRPQNIKVRPISKSWTPPLKVNTNAEKMFNRLQNSERNIGISDKSKQEINKWNSPSKRARGGREEEINTNDEDLKKKSDEDIFVIADQSSNNPYSSCHSYRREEGNSLIKEENDQFSDVLQKQLEKSEDMTLNNTNNLETGSEKINVLPEANNNSNADFKEQSSKIISNNDDSGSEVDFKFSISRESITISNEDLKTQKFCEESIESQDFVASPSKNKSGSNMNIVCDVEIIDNDTNTSKTMFRNYQIQESNSEVVNDSSEGNVFSQKLLSSPSTQLQPSTQLSHLVEVIENIDIKNKSISRGDSFVDDSCYGSNNVCELDTGADLKEGKPEGYYSEEDENDAEFFFTCKEGNNINLNEDTASKVYEFSEKDNQINLDNAENNRNFCDPEREATTCNNTEENELKIIENTPGVTSQFYEVTSTSTTLICEADKIYNSGERENKCCSQDFDEIHKNNTQEVINDNSGASNEVYEITVEVSTQNKLETKVNNLENSDQETNEDEKSETSQESCDSNLKNKDLNVEKHIFDTQNTDETFFNPLLEESQIISIHSQSTGNSQECINKLSNSNDDITMVDEYEPSTPKPSIKEEKYDDLMECSDDFYNIPMSEVIRIENEYTKTKNKDISKQPLESRVMSQKVNRNTIFINPNQNVITYNGNNSNITIPSESVIQPLQIDWIRRSEEKQKLRSIIQELNKINNIVSQIRQQLRPKQLGSN